MRVDASWAEMTVCRVWWLEQQAAIDARAAATAKRAAAEATASKADENTVDAKAPADGDSEEAKISHVSPMALESER